MDSAPDSACEQTLLEFVQQLHQGLSGQADRNSVWLHRRQSLALASSLLHQRQLPPSSRNIPQIVVVGPTQVGKSSIINLLTDSDKAGVSALAGYTRHAQGFAKGFGPDSGIDLEKAAKTFFQKWALTNRSQLDSENPKQFSIESLPYKNNLNVNQPTLYWDTPDFDSVSSRTYRTVVPTLCGLASMLVLVVSKEKYADQSVWEFMEMLSSLRIPLIICINKADPEHSDQISTEIKSRLEKIDCHYLAIVSLPWRDHDLSEADVAPLKTLVEDHVSRSNASIARQYPDSGTLAFFQRHWSEWLEPVITEHQAKGDWQRKVDDELDGLLEYYRQHYLQQQQYSEALQRAVGKLLELLEIPILAGTLGTFRKIITWPVRTAGGALLRSSGQNRVTGQSKESEILQEALAISMTSLQSEAQQAGTESRHHSQIWWRSMNQQLTTNSTEIRSDADELIERLQPDFEPEIRAAADRLYKSLESQPATLNSLRAARVTTDAAAVVLAIHTGGLSATDLVLAPALLSLTSLLAESAVGQHMKVIEKELKRKQFDQVKQRLVEELLRQALLNLSRQLPATELYHINQNQVTAAKACMEKIL